MPQDKNTIEVSLGTLVQPETVVNDPVANNLNLNRVLEIRDLFGLISTVTVAPTYIPKKFSEQIVIAVAGGANSLYVYDVSNNKWRAASLGT